ncbi:MAG: hypothetical protein HQL41_08900 [Alphaproteobacteria bacterium]|nr:hypothetical protein [Alphaproteobacteria bacterium]
MHLKEWLGWTDWKLLIGLEWKEVPKGPGTYMIAADHPLNRAVGTDQEGILDIGKSKGLRDRLKRFQHCASTPEKRGHMAGRRFALYEMTSHFPMESLYVSWRPAASEDLAAREEGRLLDEYVKQHMESPPLNYSASWRHLRAEEMA